MNSKLPTPNPKRQTRNMVMALALCAALLLAGCSYTGLKLGGGKFTRFSVGTDLGVQEASVSTNGVVTIKGLVSQQAQTAGAIAEGVAAGFAKGLKP